MTTATLKSETLSARIERVTGKRISFEDAQALRRAEITLTRWSEQECGDSNDYCSWAIERDEKTGKPYRVTYPHRGESYRSPIADRESSALKRVRAICEKNGLYFYHQTDPRGCALYVSDKPIYGNNYTNGIACSI